MHVRVQVQSWGPDCGPQPPATSSEPGGAVRVEQSGSELRLSGVMSWRTDQCFTPNRAARVTASSAGDGNWRVTCSTGKDDPRAERGTYALSAAGPDKLTFREQSKYDWQLKTSRCVATRVATRTLTREGAPAAPAAPAAPTKAEPKPAACKPGKAAKLTLSPSERTLEPGERLCFYARVVDAQGCPLDDADVHFEVRSGPAGQARMHRQCFEAGEQAAGTFVVEATAGGLGDRATVTVRAADLSDLIAGSLGADKPQAPAGPTRAEKDEAAGVAARTDTEGGGLLWPLVGGGLALLLLLAAAVLLVVRRRGGAAAPAGPPAGASGPPAGGGARPVASAQPPGPALRCPVCRRDYPAGTLFCPADGAKLGDAAEPAAAPSGQAMICPACRRGYAPTAKFCPHDSEELVPYAAFVDRQKRGDASQQEQGRICPECGERYGPNVAFCGKDGSALVLVN